MTDLQEAFREAARREFAMVPDESELDYTFSPVFQRKIQRIIRAQVHGYWNMVNTVGKRIAIAAVIIAMLLTTAMAIKPIRERVIKFFVDVYEECFAVTFGAEESGDLDPTPKPMTKYTLSFLPEGYYMENCYEFDSLRNTIWKANGKPNILLAQGTGTHETTLDHTTDNLSTFKHGTLLITQQTVDGAYTFIWEQHGYLFHLTLHDGIPVDEVLKMIDSLQETK